MSTENPKISAYVPQVIYDRFKEFQEERELSMSQAAITIFADYFGIDLTDSSTKEFTGGLPSRISQLEQLVNDLKQSYVYLLNKVDSIQTTSEPLEIELNGNPVDLSELPSKLLNESLEEIISEPPKNLPDELLSNLLIKQEDELLDDSSILSEPKSVISDSLPHQLEIIKSEKDEVSNLFVSSLSRPEIRVNYLGLAQRLGATEGYVKNKKSTSTTEEFIEWSTKKDSDGIAWEFKKDGRKAYFSPSDNLSDEQKLSLENWLKYNQYLVD